MTLLEMPLDASWYTIYKFTFTVTFIYFSVLALVASALLLALRLRFRLESVGLWYLLLLWEILKAESVRVDFGMVMMV